MEKKKTSLIIIGILLVVVTVIGVSYAYWFMVLRQTDKNNLVTSCLNVELLDEDSPILLEKAYPISDTEGESLTPFTFTLKNNCNGNVKYQINLEVLNEAKGEVLGSKRLASKYIKEKLNEVNKSGSINQLTTNKVVEKTLDNADESYELKVGYMSADEEKSFELRLWLDGNITADEKEAMNKIFASKVTIVATYEKEIPNPSLVDTIIALPTERENSGNSGLYKVDHAGANITYTDDETAIANLQKTELRYAGSDPDNYVDVGDKLANDVYSIFANYGNSTLEKCNIVKSMAESDGLEILESCTLKKNTDKLYLLEVREVFSPGMLFSDKDTCENEKSQVGDSEIISDCTIPEEYYSLSAKVGNFNTEEECIEFANNQAECKVSQRAGEPVYWRIIGLVNTPEGQRVKMVRENSIGSYSWDSSENEINSGDGVNEWSKSDLMKLLNSDYSGETVNNSLYWYGISGLCYNDSDEISVSCDFTNTKMPPILKNMIENVTWNTGSMDFRNPESEGIVSKFYEYERSSNIVNICSQYGGYQCNDEVNRTTSWNGKVGLIYPTDIAYASVGTDKILRDTCLITSLFDWSFDCLQFNNWLYSDNPFWTLLTSNFSKSAIFIMYNDSFTYAPASGNNSSVSIQVFPSVYLKPDVLVSSGNGSKDSPYVLE